MAAQRRKKQSHAILVTVIFLSGVVVTCSTVSASATDPNDLRWDLSGGFKITWDSAELSGRAVNPAGKAKDLAASPRTLNVSATLDILDANDLVAMCIATPVAFAAIDEEGNDVELEGVPTDLRLYEELRLSEVPVFRVYPFTLSIRVQFADGQVLPSTLSSLRGYIYAMYAEETIKVAVPFVETALDLGGALHTTIRSSGGVDQRCS